jgi:hypothetical protein
MAAVYALGGIPFFLTPVPVVDRIALVVSLALAAVVAFRLHRDCGPRDVRDYFMLVAFAAALTAIWGGAAVFHLFDGPALAAALTGIGTLAIAGLTAWMLRFVLFVHRLPAALEPGEELRAHAIGQADIEGRPRRVAILLTDRSLVTAVRKGAAAHRSSARDLDTVSAVQISRSGGDGYVGLETPDGLVQLSQVPPAQAVDFAAGLHARTGVPVL